MKDIDEVKDSKTTNVTNNSLFVDDFEGGAVHLTYKKCSKIP